MGERRKQVLDRLAVRIQVHPWLASACVGVFWFLFIWIVRRYSWNIALAWGVIWTVVLGWGWSKVGHQRPRSK